MKLKQECHEGRRRLHSRALLGSLVLASASLSACGDDQGEDSADLQAILHDGDLTQIMRSMLTAAPPARGTGTGGHGRRGGSGAARAPRARAARPGPGTGAGHGRRGRDGHRGHAGAGADGARRPGPDP